MTFWSHFPPLPQHTSAFNWLIFSQHKAHLPAFVIVLTQFHLPSVIPLLPCVFKAYSSWKCYFVATCWSSFRLCLPSSSRLQLLPPFYQPPQVAGTVLPTVSVDWFTRRDKLQGHLSLQGPTKNRLSPHRGIWEASPSSVGMREDVTPLSSVRGTAGSHTAFSHLTHAASSTLHPQFPLLANWCWLAGAALSSLPRGICILIELPSLGKKGLLRIPSKASLGAQMLEMEVSPLQTLIGYWLPQDPLHLLRICLILPIAYSLLELSSRRPALSEPTGGHRPSRHSLPGVCILCWQHIHSGGWARTRWKSDANAKMPKLPSHRFCACPHTLPINPPLPKRVFVFHYLFLRNFCCLKEPDSICWLTKNLFF